MKELQNNIQDSQLANCLPGIQLQRIRKAHPDKLLSVVHIGGFDGLVDTNLSKQFDNIKIHSIEACPINFKCLKENTKDNPKIIPYNTCISNINGKIDFNIYLREDMEEGKLSSQSNSIYANFLSGKEKQSIKQIQVNSQTLNSFLIKNNIKNIDLLRINCEGGEYSIFGKHSDLSFLEHTNIVHIFIHGKSLAFSSKKRMESKAAINKQIKKYGFELLYGYDLTELNKYPTGHIKQIWIRRNYE